MDDLRYNFRVDRRTALANPSLYSGRFTQENEDEAYFSWLCYMFLEAGNDSARRELVRLQKRALRRACKGKILVPFSEIVRVVSDQMSPCADSFVIPKEYVKSGEYLFVKVV